MANEPGELVTIRCGQCAISIAKESGHLLDTIWRHPANSELRSKRDEPGLLRAGDELFVPALDAGEVSCEVDKRHCFRRKGVPAYLGIRLVDWNGHPRARLQFHMEVEGHQVSGTTDDDGCIDVSIDPTTQRAVLSIGASVPEDEDEDSQVLVEAGEISDASSSGGDGERYELWIGSLEPIGDETACKQRLVNLGYLTEAENDAFGAPKQMALKKFQRKHNLAVSGEQDSATKSTLAELHRS